MNAIGGLLLLALGAVLAYPAGWLRCYRAERKYRQRADWRCDQLIRANEQLRQERTELNEFLSVVVPTDWETS